jgi:hypothetical protein
MQQGFQFTDTGGNIWWQPFSKYSSTLPPKIWLGHCLYIPLKPPTHEQYK